MKTFKTTIASIKRETHDTATLRLDLGGQEFKYKAGQAINIDPHQFSVLSSRIKTLEESGEVVMPRGFSLSSHQLEKGYVEITVKAELNPQRPPLLSPYLVNETKVGENIIISLPFGSFTLPDKIASAIEGVIHIAAGSGIAPSRGILKYALATNPRLKHILFVQNKTADDIIYKSEFDSLMKVHKDSVKIIHVLSRPESSESRDRHSSLSGYITSELIKEQMKNYLNPQRCLAFVCGPNKPRKGHNISFIETFAGKGQILEKLGVISENIITETW